jgi:acyl-CoA-dependent ceramide synthase
MLTAEYSLAVVAGVGALHQLAPMRQYTDKFLRIQYVNSERNIARIGRDDALFVAFWVVSLVLIRAVMMQYVFAPIGRYLKLKTHKAQVRFSEQGWSFTYFLISTAAGLVLLMDTPYKNSPIDLWKGWPHYELNPWFKVYYLVQLASWISQMYTLNIEEKRKDHNQMFLHHIVTCVLVSGSYYYSFTRIGHVILLLMDNGDAFLAAAKMLKYMNYQTMCDVMFGLFLVSWVVCRHALYLFFTYSAATDGTRMMTPDCHYDSDGDLVLCGSLNVHRTFVGLLLLLHCLILVWFYMIIKVVIKILRGGNAEEPRSDDEDD